MRFWDASALVPLAVDEPSSGAIRALYQQDQDIVAWWGTSVECVAAVARAVRRGRLDVVAEGLARTDLQAILATIVEIAPAEDVRERAERLLPVHPLSAADAFQLGAALTWAQERPLGRAFVCLDERLRAAAMREGFTILP